MAQIGTIRIETGAGPVDVPVFEQGDSGSTVIEAWRVETPSGVGFVPLAPTADATNDFLRVETGQGTYGLHDSAQTAVQATVDTTLNSGTATIWFYEDTNQDGTADNVEEVSLSNGSNTYTLNSFSGGTGNDYWWYVSAEPSSETSRVEINSVDISA